MALKLRKKNSDPQNEESEIQDDPSASSAAESVPDDPSPATVPNVSFNLMTVRYILQRRRNIASMITLGVVAAIGLLLIGQWLRVNAETEDLFDQRTVADSTIVTLNEQITTITDTAGLTPNQVSKALNERASAFTAATSNQIDYISVFNSLRALDTQSAWLTSITLSAQSEEGVKVSVSGLSSNFDDAILWKNSVSRISSLSNIPRLPTLGGSPSEDAGVTWSLPEMLLAEDVKVDLRKLHDLADLPVVGAAPAEGTPEDVEEPAPAEAPPVEEGGES